MSGQRPSVRLRNIEMRTRFQESEPYRRAGLPGPLPVTDRSLQAIPRQNRDFLAWYPETSRKDSDSHISPTHNGLQSRQPISIAGSRWFPSQMPVLPELIASAEPTGQWLHGLCLSQILSIAPLPSTTRSTLSALALSKGIRCSYIYCFFQQPGFGCPAGWLSCRSS